MVDPTPGDKVIANPTYMGDIRHMFEQIDIDHMAAKGYDLATYSGVRKNALAIFAHTSPPNADMPPQPERHWSAARSQIFKNWILHGYPIGAATPAPPMVDAVGPAELIPRTRKSVTDLDQSELDKLRAAFNGICARPPTESTSYYALASIHGLPQTYCLHHEDRYNPWHRVYLKLFEDALRTVPGCENLTMPYWDIRSPIPDVLKHPPFDEYVVPVALRTPYGANYRTLRFDQPVIDDNLASYRVLKHLDAAQSQSLWGVSGINGFQDETIAGHDGGHLSIGPTMADQNVASYDPIFWFFHCNLDRLWLRWQQRVDAVTLAKFKSTLSDNTAWLTAPFNALDPFLTTADQTIDFPGIVYRDPVMPHAESPFENMVGSIDANRAFTVRHTTPVSVMVKNINRLNIPGSFVVTLMADGRPLARRAFFQPNAPRDCSTCRKLALVNVNFRVNPEEILNRKLSIDIGLPSHDGIGRSFPLSAVGNPTINARLLLEDSP